MYVLFLYIYILATVKEQANSIHPKIPLNYAWVRREEGKAAWRKRPSQPLPTAFISTLWDAFQGHRNRPVSRTHWAVLTPPAPTEDKSSFIREGHSCCLSCQLKAWRTHMEVREKEDTGPPLQSNGPWQSMVWQGHSQVTLTFNSLGKSRLDSEVSPVLI